MNRVIGKNVMRRLVVILILFVVLLTGTLYAIPAKRVVKSVMQPDGTTLTIVLQGDEYFHYTTTVDGIMVQESSDGSMRYAVASAQGLLSVGEHVAHDPDKRDALENAYVKQIDTGRIDQAVRKIRAMESSSQRFANRGKSNFPNQGTVHGLIILAQYKDVKFSANSSPEEFWDMMNVEGYSNNNASGSARDYFIDQSSGVFTPEFDIVGPVTLPENMSYYGGNTMFGRDKNPAEMIVDACYAADTLLNVDFSQYDYDDDGKVDLVYVIYAGYAEAQGGPSGSVWPHAWDLENAGFNNIRMDGKLIHSYACSSELHGETGKTIDGIGTFCHEFSHCLGLPDIYDTRSTGMFGMGSWSLMDHGAYNNQSRTPAGYSAYERYCVGWLDPILLKEPQKGIKLPALNLSNQAYMLVSDFNPNEYYTIENRQQSGWDTYLPGHGMMIVHVDYVPSLWEGNIINSSVAGYAHLQIVPADNEFDDYTGDLFPGITRNFSFTDESTPASILYSGGFLSKPLSRIQEDKGMITFDYMHFIGTPVATKATDITAESFTANWEPVNNATSYVLEIAACMTGRKSLSEEFGSFTKGSVSVVDGQDVADVLDDFTEVGGWTGDNVYQAGGYACIGNKSTGGSLMTPLLDFTKEKEFTLRCSVKGTKNLREGYNFQLLDASGKLLLDKEVMMNASEKTIYWVFNTEAEAGRIRIVAKAAAMLDCIHFYDGNVKEQLENGTALDAPEEYEKEISGITGHSYTLAGLAGNKRYIYSVYAKLNEEISQKSSKIIVQTQTPVGMESLSLLNEVYTKKGTLCFTADSKGIYHVYTSSGILIRTGINREGLNEILLHSGFYILTVGTERFKIYIP